MSEMYNTSIHNFVTGPYLFKEIHYLCVLMPTHCTIARFGFRTRQIDGVVCDIFSIHAPLGQTTLRVGRVSVQCIGGSYVRVTVCVSVCVIVLCGILMKGREKVKPGGGS